MKEKRLTILLVIGLQALNTFPHPNDQINVTFKITYNNFEIYYN